MSLLHLRRNSHLGIMFMLVDGRGRGAHLRNRCNHNDSDAIRFMQTILSVGCAKTEGRTAGDEQRARRGAGFAAHL